MELSFRPLLLRLAHRWTIASRTGPGGGPGSDECAVLVLRLRDGEGAEGLGESAPSNRYLETVATVQRFLARVDPERLSFHDVPGSMAYLETVSPNADAAAKCALNTALLDGAARLAGLPLHAYLGLPFTEDRHLTSFSIGIDSPERIHAKVLAAADRPVLKLKLGSAADPENLAALRAAAPTKPVRVDANEAWRTREEALARLEWLAQDGHIQFVEQPMPASLPRTDWLWLKERSPLPIMADESYRSAADLPAVLGCFHAVNVKLVKTGGPGPALLALRAARAAGLQTMLGCMIETSILIAAAAHLADLTDHLDLDGNLLVTNDPYRGFGARGSILSLAAAPARTGLCVAPAEGAPL